MARGFANTETGNARTGAVHWLFLLLLVALIGGCGAGLLWRYTPIRVRPEKITKVIDYGPERMVPLFCEDFSMTVAEFSAYFAKVHRLTPLEDGYYGYGGCYYEAKIEGRLYRIWSGGVAQIIDETGTEEYADSARKLSEPSL
jgi:hypothetical protein